MEAAAVAGREAHEAARAPYRAFMEAHVYPNETALEGFPGAVLLPLSSFDPARIPDPEGKEVVFACRSGRRSVTASQAAQAAGLPYDAHLAGGILAWKAAGHPTES